MGINLNFYREKIVPIIKETLSKPLYELFDTPPFKDNFDFEEDFSSYHTQFSDPKGNSIKIYFHKDNNKCYLLDFTVNNTSGKAKNINYSLKDYTALLGTVAKATSQFMEEYQPNAIRIEGEDYYEKVVAGKAGQKLYIYTYFASQLRNNSDYMVGNRDKEGGFNIIRKNK